MTAPAPLDHHHPLVDKFLSAVREDFRITEAIARNAASLIARQQTRLSAREEQISGE